MPLDAAGRIPASQAVALVVPIVATFDADFRVVGIYSDSNIDARGGARQWDLFIDLPSRGSQLTATVAPCDPSSDDDSQACLSLREKPFLPDYEDEAAVRKIAKEIGLTWEEWSAKRVELAMAQRHPALPAAFVDSPRAVAELSAAGIDFVSGPTDITLSTKRLTDGTVVWEAQAGGVKRETPFTDRGAAGRHDD